VQPPTSNPPSYTEYHPRWYRPRVSVYWWMGSWRYLKFILRELSSAFVAVAVIMTLFQLRALRAGPDAYARFEQRMRSPVWIALSLISLIFVVFHAITWFNLTPRAMAIRLRGKRLPDVMVAAPNYAIWLVVSAGVAWMVLR